MYLFVTTLTLAKTQPENVCQAVELTVRLHKSKIAFVFRDAQLNPSELSQKTSLTLVCSQGHVPPIVMLKTTLVSVFCTVPKLHQ